MRNSDNSQVSCNKISYDVIFDAAVKQDNFFLTGLVVVNYWMINSYFLCNVYSVWVKEFNVVVTQKCLIFEFPRNIVSAGSENYFSEHCPLFPQGFCQFSCVDAVNAGNSSF